MSSLADPTHAGTREALLEAGLLCFSERGFESTSLRMVAERAGKTTSLIAHHFGNKEGLFLAVFQDMLAHQRPEHLVSPDVELSCLKESPARAAAVLRDIVLRMSKNIYAKFESGDPKQLAYVRLWMSAIHMPIPELEPLLRERLRPVRLQMAACIQAIRPDLPDREIPYWCAFVHGQCVVNPMLRSIHQVVFGPECYPESADLLAERVADITLRALGGSEASGKPRRSTRESA